MDELVSTFRWDLLWHAITERVYREIIRPHVLLNGNADEWIGRVAAFVAMGVSFRLLRSIQTAIAAGTLSGVAAAVLVYFRRRWRARRRTSVQQLASDTTSSTCSFR
ncbi:hypothetical protein H257_04421 [Aphanomyces astaci]|uniref:Uncharacterized protein n=1 Tax=Aphanomyces astaci TaxID=112090 RepID=W4GY08_APHAT|nr:hypothetical protein H257_04421 [Aphanomyces astaci]ETV83803.1 hypothetical protein H257_04421 [Aphanomyces astaci]|eukprot:XP_009827233.1 hypothetical protein H257_04421 [Aphanomyces astaci]